MNFNCRLINKHTCNGQQQDHLVFLDDGSSHFEHAFEIPTKHLKMGLNGKATQYNGTKSLSSHHHSFEKNYDKID